MVNQGWCFPRKFSSLFLMSLLWKLLVNAQQELSEEEQEYRDELGICSLKILGKEEKRTNE
jgi:hypothetical protein